MRKPKRIFRNYVLPLVILLPLVGLMVGCFYIPTFDHTLLVGTKKDFRGWAKDHTGSSPLLVSQFSRSSIETMFGQPAFFSNNGKCVAYVMGSEHGIWVWPLCFGAGFDQGKTHVLKLVYDDHDRLKRVVPLEEGRSPPMYLFLQNTNNGTADPLVLARYLLIQANNNCSSDEVIEMPPFVFNGKVSTPQPATQP
jgi:hypothetical protein